MIELTEVQAVVQTALRNYWQTLNAFADREICDDVIAAAERNELHDLAHEFRSDLRHEAAQYATSEQDYKNHAA
jgi:hypothetical protein